MESLETRNPVAQRWLEPDLLSQNLPISRENNVAQWKQCFCCVFRLLRVSKEQLRDVYGDLFEGYELTWMTTVWALLDAAIAAHRPRPVRRKALTIEFDS